MAEAIALVNASRDAADLVEHGDLAAVAQRHAERMAAENRLYHNPSLGREVSGYELVGENVGVGPELGPIHQAFLDSPSHRANIVEGRFSQIGIGLATDGDGSLWIVQVFRQPTAAAAAPAPAPALAPAPAPVPAPAVVAPAPAPAPPVAPVAPVASVAAVEPTPEPVAPAPVVDLTPDVVRGLTAAFVWPDVQGAVETLPDAASEPAVPVSLALFGLALVLAVGTRTARTVRITRSSDVVIPRLAPAAA